MKLASILLACILTACESGPPISPLIVAARQGDTVSIVALVHSGADVNQRGGVNNWTPLMHAVHKNQPASVRTLLDAGADVNLTAGARGRDTALRLAGIDGDTEIATMLRAGGAK